MATTGSIYIHIPFCKKKCPYCHFFVVKSKEELIQEYLHSLQKEWSIKSSFISQFSEIESIYLGGGTPSQLTPEQIKTILDPIFATGKVQQSAEITIEVNPEDSSFETFSAYKKLGINRISMGVQTLHEPLLKMIGRSHGAREAKEAICLAKEAGFTNISIDLMYDLPEQTKEDFIRSIEAIENLPITHLSLYNLIVEPGSAYYRRKMQIEHLMPTDESSYEMLEFAKKKLSEFDFDRYEISAFAKKGFQAVHNSRYWIGKPFIGLGPSAFSYFAGKRFQNHPNLKRYFEDCLSETDPISFQEKLCYPDDVHELLAVRLRLLEGAPLNEYDLPETTHKTLQRLKNEGFISFSDGRVFLTDKGVDFYDSVAVELI